MRVVGFRNSEPAARTFLKILAGIAVLSAPVVTSLLPQKTAAQAMQNSDKTTPACYQVAPARGFSWITSGVWAQQGQVLFADVLSRQVHRMGLEGQAFPALVTRMEKEGDSSGLEHPSEIRPLADGGFFVEDEKLSPTGIDELVRFDASLDQVGEVQIKNRPLQNGSKIQVLYDWTPWGDHGFLAFADIKSGNDWTSSFIYFDENGNDQIFLTLPVQSEPAYQHTKENHYLSVVGDIGYILLFEEEPQLISVQLNGQESLGQDSFHTLAPLPRDFRKRPQLRENPSFMAASGKPVNQMTLYFEQLEKSAAALEIHALGDRLFLLGKTPATRDKSFRNSSGSLRTEFSLVELDPGSGEELGRVRLPTGPRVGHLEIVPGPSHWALIGKEYVQGLGAKDHNAPFMRHQGPVFVPSSWFDDLGFSPLAQSVSCPILEK